MTPKPPVPAASHDGRIETVAEEAIALLNTGRQVPPFSARFPELSLPEAYQVTAAVRRRREERGERAIGRKIGFTNRTIWREYAIYAPIWGYIYDSTVHDLPTLRQPFTLAGLAEPKIEPEIVFGLADPPEPGMDEAALIGCINWVAHGFEIVQSVFPGWRFAAADTVAAYGLHGALFIGPRHTLGAERAGWVSDLARFEIDLFRDGAIADHGRAANVLDGPLFALKHLVEFLAADPVNPPLAAGEIVTTGTLTRAFPAAPGQVWSTALSGIALDGVSLRFGPAG